MPDGLTLAAGLSVAAWVVLLVFRYGFWKCDQRLGGDAVRMEDWPSVAAIVPARNEAGTVANCLNALGAQDYPGRFSVLLVNDSSTDGTGETARRTAVEAASPHPIRVIDAPALEAGWAGKLWALESGLGFTSERGEEPDYLWFTDADIIHQPRVLQSLVAKAQQDDLAMVSLMVKLACRSFWEQLLVPAFIFFFQMLYPFPAINDRSNRSAGAAGGCILLKAEALKSAGGLAAMKDRLIDDCALGQAVKSNGNGIWLGLAAHSDSLRRYLNLGEFWQMVARSAYVQLRHSPVLLVVSVAGMALTFMAGPVLLLTAPFHGNAAAGLLAAVSTLAMAVAYTPTLKYHGLAKGHALLLPFAALLYMCMTIHSAIRHWIGAGSSWKERVYSAE